MSLEKKPVPDTGPHTHHLRHPPPGASRVHMLASRLKRMLDGDMNTVLAKHCALSLPEWRILSGLSDSTTSVSQKELVERIGFAQGQTSRAIDALEADGLIVARQSEADRRSWRYTISEQGLAQFKKLLPHIVERRDALEGVLTRAEIENFEIAATKVLAELHNRQQT